MLTPHPILDDFIPDDKVQGDLLKILWDDDPECEIELEQEKITVPRDTILEVVSKSYRHNNYQIGFGNYYATQVAIGGVKECRFGILYPKYCFATLFYNLERNLITTDVHSEMR